MYVFGFAEYENASYLPDILPRKSIKTSIKPIFLFYC